LGGLEREIRAWRLQTGLQSLAVFESSRTGRRRRQLRIIIDTPQKRIVEEKRFSEEKTGRARN
jgi:hypothetical protein